MTNRETTPAVAPQSTVSVFDSEGAPAAILDLSLGDLPLVLLLLVVVFSAESAFLVELSPLSFARLASIVGDVR